MTKFLCVRHCSFSGRCAVCLHVSDSLTPDGSQHSIFVFWRVDAVVVVRWFQNASGFGSRTHWRRHLSEVETGLPMGRTFLAHAQLFLVGIETQENLDGR